ncbi:hypothetical protein AAMO2058_000389900 [Amorphochlora amoebiformis]
MARKNPMVKFLKVDVDKFRDISAAYKIKAMPTFKAFRNGTLTGTLQGADPNKLGNLLGAERKAYEDAAVFRVGTKVVLHSLKKEVFNGLSAEILGYTSGYNRYKVTFKSTDNKSMVKNLAPKNLHQVIDVEIMSSAGDTKTLKGVFAKRDGQTYSLTKIQDGEEVKGIQVEQLRIPKNCRAKVSGLKVTSRNDQTLAVLGFNPATNRYAVVFGDGKKAAVKPENLTIL